MTKTRLKQLILEAVKDALKKKRGRVADSYITSDTEKDVSLFVNIRFNMESVEEAEKLRKEILKDLKTNYDATVREEK